MFLRTSLKQTVAPGFACVVLAFLPGFSPARAVESLQPATVPAERRFEAEIRALVATDQAKPPQRGGIVFVGSSIFRLWTNVTEHMAPLPVVNRAFGGSRTGDQLDRFEQVVTPCAPKVVVYYCGSNDLKADEQPETIFERFKAFSERLRRGFPETRLIFVSATRSPDRVARWDRVDRYNALVRGYCAAAPQHTFVDINPVLFNQAGQPRRELYLKDELHFLPPAYDEFASVLKPVLTRLWNEVAALATHSPANKISDNKELQAFLDCQLIPKLGNAWDYLFAPGEFPRIEWDRPEIVEKFAGKFPIKVRWFDADGREVITAEKPGRYAFYAEGTTPGGLTIRRSATLFCRPPAWDGWSEKLRASLDFIPLDGLSRAAWEEHRDAIADHAGRTVLLSILRQREGAVLMAYLHELKANGATPAPTDTPLIRDHEYHLALKRKILGVETKYPALRPPMRSAARTAPVMRTGTEADAGFQPGTVGRLREVARAWFEHSGEPFNLVVARRGVAVLDESFGNYTWGPLTRTTPSEMASITKLLTGVLFAQFVEQGLIGIDDPVGKYLPDFPVTGDAVLTLRHCFTHASGLNGHEEWDGMHNPWLENVIACAGVHLRPGQVHNYNGMGYDLAGKVMEMVSGKSVFRLMHENLFLPLGMTNTTITEDLGFSCFSTAADFAKLGQLLLNRGTYGETSFCSPQVFEQLLPQPLNRFYPAITNKDWGIGITWMRQRHPQAGTNGIPKDATVLSRNVIGHGSATAAILRVDLDKGLVITQTRRRGGPDYDKHLESLLLVIESGLQDTPTNSRSADKEDPPRLGAVGVEERKPSDSSVALAVNKAILEGRTGRFIAERYESEAGGTLPFQVFIPTHVARDKRYPLLVFLHGAGELGDDNQSQLVGFPREFVVPETQAKHPCFAIAPQCPKSDAWSSFPEYPASARASASPTAATRLVIELVERLVAGGRIDPARVYVTGLSLGGEGTFDIVSRRPDLFAAAVPVCGIADVARASSMARVPFWIFHGDQDDINPVKYSRDAFHALTANGAKPIYTEYQGAGHDIWKRAYNEPGLVPWLFKQHR